MTSTQTSKWLGPEKYGILSFLPIKAGLAPMRLRIQLDPLALRKAHGVGERSMHGRRGAALPLRCSAALLAPRCEPLVCGRPRDELEPLVTVGVVAADEGAQ